MAKPDVGVARGVDGWIASVFWATGEGDDFLVVGDGRGLCKDVPPVPDDGEGCGVGEGSPATGVGDGLFSCGVGDGLLGGVGSGDGSGEGDGEAGASAQTSPT